jgi:hypothetical protein
MKPIVDFLIIGAQKCGTTTLSEYLSKHPEVAFSKIKEPHFFVNDNVSNTHLTNYHSFFNKKKNQIAGEGSTHYSMYPYYLNCHKNIFSYNPKMKLIYIVRDPVERIVSLYKFLTSRRELSKPINQAIVENFNFLSPGLYYSQLKLYLDLFGRESILLLNFDDLVNSPNLVLQKMAYFLKIDSVLFQQPGIHKNSSGELTLPKNSFIADFRGKPLFNSIRSLLPETLRKKLIRNFYTTVSSPKLEEDLIDYLKNIYYYDYQKILDIVD